MNKRLRTLALLLALALLPALALAEEATLPLPEGMEVEGVAEETEVGGNTLDSERPASIEGLKPLYTTKIKPFVANGKSIRMRTLQSTKSEEVCVISAGETITVYAVYPAFVLAEYEGNVGYIIRTWVDEYMTAIDPVSTPPYGVVLSQFVATLTETATIYASPEAGAAELEIRPAKGDKVAILEFVNGFAKVLYHRDYGYIDARVLSDLVVVAQGDEPMSEDTPIAAFSSFFEYNTGKEGNDGRCKNIARSCLSMSRVMQPGEQLDFNNDVGPYRKSNGYFPAPVLIDGGSQLGYGGGTCQSSSTLYNTVRQVPGITILRRRPHGPGCARYLPMHQDAAVGNSELNFVFRNDNPYPIRILAESTGQGVLTIQIFKVQE